MQQYFFGNNIVHCKYLTDWLAWVGGYLRPTRVARKTNNRQTLRGESLFGCGYILLQVGVVVDFKFIKTIVRPCQPANT